jgi:hypothetical protein
MVADRHVWKEGELCMVTPVDDKHVPPGRLDLKDFLIAEVDITPEQAAEYAKRNRVTNMIEGDPLSVYETDAPKPGRYRVDLNKRLSVAEANRYRDRQRSMNIRTTRFNILDSLERVTDG